MMVWGGRGISEAMSLNVWIIDGAFRKIFLIHEINLTSRNKDRTSSNTLWIPWATQVTWSMFGNSTFKTYPAFFMYGAPSVMKGNEYWISSVHETIPGEDSANAKLRDRNYMAAPHRSQLRNYGKGQRAVLKKSAGALKTTRSRLVYLLARETFLIEDLKTTFVRPYTRASEKLQSLRKRR